MIDFQNAKFLKLKRTQDDEYDKIILPLLVPNEEVLSCFRTVRDGVVFTNKRIFTINMQGLTGKKKDITSLPYRKIQGFSIETAGHFDLDSELVLWYSGIGELRFEFLGSSNIMDICRYISCNSL